MKAINIPLEKLIASKDIIAQCKKENRIFTPFEQVALIYQNPLFTFDEMRFLFRQIDEAVKNDVEYGELHQQLNEWINYHEQLLEKFYSDEKNQYFYLSYNEGYHSTKGDDVFFSDDRCFSNLKSLFMYVDENFTFNDIPNYTNEIQIDNTTDFIVHKCYLDNDIEIRVKFNKEKKIKKVESSDFEHYHLNSSNNFTGASIEVPYPFRNGDFVQTIGESDIYIFANCKDEKEYERQKYNRNVSQTSLYNPYYTDIKCQIEALTFSWENPRHLCFKTFSPNLLTLEYATLKEDNENYYLLKSAQALMRGEGNLSVFCDYLLEGKRSPWSW